MVIHYETLVGKKVDEMIMKNFNDGIVDCMEDEVTEDTSGLAKFMTRNEISNVVDGNEVILGGDNVILNPNENSNGINVKSFGVQDFRDSVDVLGLEDVKLTGYFFTWVQKRRDPISGVLKKLDRIMCNDCFMEVYPTTFANFLPFRPSNHSRAILVLLDVLGRKKKALNYLSNKEGFFDKVGRNWNVLVKGHKMFVLVKRLKFLKKHMRDLNRENVNVCEKSKIFKEELCRVQDALSKDPFNVDLREEELLYADAYKKAVLDKELLLKQKSKIKWLKEEDFNTFYFHKIVKGKVIRNIIDVIYNEEGKDPDGLFINKLDLDTAAGMINDVSDMEIISALSDIEDNKASGPDGYTLKKFKSAWKVVGSDFYLAIKEFFSSGKLLGLLQEKFYNSICNAPNRCSVV
uniref:RNA-directed DNA polymerase, eukaryota, reverse transcriptase zinc-binding domain protein n=1 Tax=Tanacetum cinerariifolium TaxID=118510 RepID=A0A699H4M0_TANCI|nr:hypothetical protein [Tanacetum cinerariifolium]